MISAKTSLDHKRIRLLICLVLTFFVLLGISLQSVAGSLHYSMMTRNYGTIDSPPVILHNGTAGTSTIYTNSTSAKVSVVCMSQNETKDYVDLLSNVDNSTDVGTHSNFTAQQYGPDLVNDTLTEQDTVGSGNLVIRPNGVGKKSDWNPIGSTNNWECADEVTPDEDTTFVNTTTKSKKDFYDLQNHTSETGSILNVRLYVRAKGDTGSELNTRIIVGVTEYQGSTHTLTTSYANYYNDWATNPAGGNWTWSDIDALEAGFMSSTSASVEHRVTQLYINVTYGPNYELDLEVQWTNVDYDETSEYLCIYGGTMSTENIAVDAWNGTAWNTLLVDLSSGWNNITVSSYLNSSNFTIRFKGNSESNDPAQDSWNIDATLLHVWTYIENTYDSVLRVNNTSANPWEIRLKKYSNSSINRLENCTISFHNSTDGRSSQIVIEDGAFVNETGSWYDLGSLETIYLEMTVAASSIGTSNIYTYIEIHIPDTTTYAQYFITFEIT